MTLSSASLGTWALTELHSTVLLAREGRAVVGSRQEHFWMVVCGAMLLILKGGVCHCSVRGCEAQWQVVEGVREQCREVFFFQHAVGVRGGDAGLQPAGSPSVPTVFTSSDAAGGDFSSSHWKAMSRCFKKEGLLIGWR